MKVIKVNRVKGRGTVIIVDELPGNVDAGDVLVTGAGDEWRIRGIECGTTARPRVGAGLILSGHEDDMPMEGNVLFLKPRDLLKEKLSEVTLGEFLKVWSKDQKDRVELADVLKELHHAIDLLEAGMRHDDIDRMKAFKRMRETFNEISPKWSHT